MIFLSEMIALSDPNSIHRDYQILSGWYLCGYVNRGLNSWWTTFRRGDGIRNKNRLQFGLEAVSVPIHVVTPVEDPGDQWEILDTPRYDLTGAFLAFINLRHFPGITQ